MVEPVYEGGFLTWHTLWRGYHLAPVSGHRVEGDEYVTTSDAGELRLPLRLFHDAGHGAILALNNNEATSASN